MKHTSHKILFFTLFIAVITLSSQHIQQAFAAWVHNEPYIVATGAAPAIDVAITTRELPTTPATTPPGDNLTLPGQNQTELRWSTQGSPDACTASGSWSGAKTAASGTIYTENKVYTAPGTYTYTLNCTKGSGASLLTATDTKIVQVNAATSPSGGITAPNCVINTGTSCTTVVGWTTSNVPSGATITRNVGTPAVFSTSPSGTQNATIQYGSETFTLTHNTAPATTLGSTTATASCPSSKPTFVAGVGCVLTVSNIDLTVSPSSVPTGGTSTITWTLANASNCMASASPANGGWQGAKDSSNGVHTLSVSVGQTTDFTINCTEGSDTKTVTVTGAGGPGIGVSLTASPVRIPPGGTTPVTLTWTPTGSPTSCISEGPTFAANTTVGGSDQVYPSVDTTYTIKCVKGSQTVRASALVSIKKKFLFIEF